MRVLSMCVLKIDLLVIPQSHLICSFDVDGCLKVNCSNAPFHVVSPHHFVSPHLSAVLSNILPASKVKARIVPQHAEHVEALWSSFSLVSPETPGGIRWFGVIYVLVSPCFIEDQGVLWSSMPPFFPFSGWVGAVQAREPIVLRD